MTVETRPPRPVHTSPELLQRVAELMGMKEREITSAVPTEHGIVVITHDGTRSIIVPEDKPDGLGQTGVLCWPLPGHPTPRYARVYADPGIPSPLERGEAWTVEDLDVAASKVSPPVSNAPGSEPWRQWIGGDPVRAYAAWTYIANRRGDSMRTALAYSQPAAWARSVVIESGLLDPSEAAKL